MTLMLAACVQMGSFAASPPSPRQLADPVLSLDAAVEIDGLSFALGPATLTFDRGWLLPARLPDGRIAEVVFTGEGRFHLQPPDEIEAGQLALFTGETSLDVEVREAVLVSADEQRLSSFFAASRPAATASPAVLEAARTLHARWLDSTERRHKGIAPALTAAHAGDAAYAGYYAAWVVSPQVGDFLYRMDPDAFERITVSSYEPPELSYRERIELQRYLRAQHRRGRSLGTELSDFGAWDVWMSMNESAGVPSPAGFEPRHYEIEASILRDRMMLDGRVRIELETLLPGRRSVRLHLMSDLEIVSVAGAEGQPLDWVRSGEQITAVLPVAPEVGSHVKLEVAYRGRALQWAAGSHHLLTDTTYWYPHAGTVDRATYDVTLSWPARYDLIAPGRLAGEGLRGKYRWQRRLIDQPSIAHSFVLGDYEIEQTSVRDVPVLFAYERHGLPSAAERAETVRAVAGALEFFERSFGPYPYEGLTVATVPRDFSQSLPAFVTLARSAGRLRRNWPAPAMVSHELAHQWWGNAVGWHSYRDQWLSESMANYTALLYEMQRRGDSANLLAMMTEGWRGSLSQRTVEGRTIESLGPLTLGLRLNSSLSLNAYRPIVYRKGAVVLAMLARAVGEQLFARTLRELAESHLHGVLTTEAFLSAVERASGLDLESFARQYVYGTGMPQILYRYDVTQDESGSWILRAEARRIEEPVMRYRIARGPSGTLDVVAHPAPPVGAADVGELLVPFELRVERAADGDELQQVERGRIALRGLEDRFEIRSTGFPLGFRLDPDGELLATFRSERDEPKLYLRERAVDLAAEERWDEAERTFLEALRVASPTAGRSRDERRDRRDRTEDLRTALALVRMYIDSGRDERALALLDRTESRLRAGQQEQLVVERNVLRARLDIRRGELAPARRRLKRTLQAADPASGSSWRDVLGQVRLNAERGAIIEAHALLAIATIGLDYGLEHSRAIAAARARGVDVSALVRSSDELRVVEHQ